MPHSIKERLNHPVMRRDTDVRSSVLCEEVVEEQS